jgi:hypothetical protein
LFDLQGITAFALLSGSALVAQTMTPDAEKQLARAI